MARRCDITGKGVMTGNKVSHAMNKSRRRFLPNVQNTSVMSDILGEGVRMKVTSHGLRTIEHNGGLDAFLLSTPNRKLPLEARKVKRRIEKAQAKKAATASVEAVA
jgi:large subunit ribosomal protein L28